MNYSIADKSTPTQLHTERGKVLKAVNYDLGRVGFEVSPDREGQGADLVLWENRGERTWGIPVYHLSNRDDAEAVAKALNGLVDDGLLRTGPLLPTNDSVAEAPSFAVASGGALGGTGVRLAGGEKGNVWSAQVHYLKSPEEAKGLNEALNHLLTSKTIRSGALQPESRLQDLTDDVAMGMSRLADKDQGIMDILQAVHDASMKVDPKNWHAQWLPLQVLDQAGVYGKDIEGLYQVCGRHPGKMVAVLRGSTIGLIDAPAIKAAIKPVGIHRAGGLDVDGIVAAVESVIPEFSASRVSPPSLTAPEVPNVSADIHRIAREGQGQPQPGQARGGFGDTSS